MRVAGVLDTGFTVLSVQKLEMDASGGQLYLVVDGRKLFSFDLVDIHDILFSPNCGLFFSAPDNNQVWRGDIGGGDCVALCADDGVDSSSCAFLQDPFGIAIGE